MASHGPSTRSAGTSAAPGRFFADEQTSTVTSWADGPCTGRRAESAPTRYHGPVRIPRPEGGQFPAAMTDSDGAPHSEGEPAAESRDAENGRGPGVVHRIVIPPQTPMVSLLGAARRGAARRRAVLPAGPTSTSAATRSRVTGPSGEVALVERLVDELLTVLGAGQAADRRTPSSARSACCGSRPPSGPADVLTLNILSSRGRDDPAEDAEPEALRRRDRRAHDRLRHRPGRHRQDLPGDGQGRAGAAGQAGQPDHPDPARGRGRGAARLPARHARREDRPVPAPALRRAARHDRPGARSRG